MSTRNLLEFLCSHYLFNRAAAPSRLRSLRIGSTLMSLALLAHLALLGGLVSPARAQTPSTTSMTQLPPPSSLSGDRYERLCGPIIRAAEEAKRRNPGASTPESTEGGGQKLLFFISLDENLSPPEGHNPQLFQYCRAAKSAKATYPVQVSTAALWGAVAGTCLVACIYPPATTVCSVASVTGGVGDALISSNLGGVLSALTSIGTNLALSAATSGAAGAATSGAAGAAAGAGTGAAGAAAGAGTGAAGAAAGAGTGAAGAAAGAGTGAAASATGTAASTTRQTSQTGSNASRSANSGNRLLSCVNFATAAVQTAVKSAGAIQTDKSIDRNLDNAQTLGSSTGTSVNISPPSNSALSGLGARSGTSGSPTTGAQSSNNPNTNGGAAPNANNNSASQSPCQTAPGSGDFQAIASCAQTQDPNGSPNVDPQALQNELNRTLPGAVEAISRSFSPSATLASIASQTAASVAGTAAGEQVGEVMNSLPNEVMNALAPGPTPSPGAPGNLDGSSNYSLNLSHSSHRSAPRKSGIDSTISSLLSRLKNPNAADKGKPQFPVSQNFAGHANPRAAAEAAAERISQNRNFGLFERISQRYRHLAAGTENRQPATHGY
jgi:hypothetical protein